MDDKFSIVVFPFLKTQEQFNLGNLIFRSTLDLVGMPDDQAKMVHAIAAMLFLKDDLRLDNATFTIIPRLDLEGPLLDMQLLIDIQSVIAFLYCSPHQTFGDPFLDLESSSLVILNPTKVSSPLVRPDFNVTASNDVSLPEGDSIGQIDGYHGLYNFVHHFWVASGSRIYGPKPHITLNIDQNLGQDLQTVARRHVHYRLLVDLLRQPRSEFSEFGERIFTALRWYNSSNRESNDEGTSLVHLAIAFESLLGLPQSDKTDRLVDSISLLLGRTPRLDIWARQFYDARSDIVHEGYSRKLNYVAKSAAKDKSIEEHQPLILYGKQIFRVCLGTLLYGFDLTDKANLQQTFVTNHERFEFICRKLSDETIVAQQRMAEIASTVRVINQRRFAHESNLRIATIIGAIKLASKTLMECNTTLDIELETRLQNMTGATREADLFVELEALCELAEGLPIDWQSTADQCQVVAFQLISDAWSYLFMHYYWTKDSRAASEEE